MRRINLKLALVAALVAAVCAGAAGVYATGGSTGPPAAGDASAIATPPSRSFSSATCAISAGECNDVVREPELTCEEAHACATRTLPDVVCENEEACPPGRRICPGVTPEPMTPGTFDNSIAICGTPCDVCPAPEPCAAPGCHVACPAFAPGAEPGAAPDVACPLPTCPAAIPAAGSNIAPAIARYCGPLPCASTEGECEPPPPCALRDSTAACPPPPRCLPVAPAPPEPGESEPQISSPGCLPPLPPDCAISNDGAVSCPTPSASGGDARSVPPAGAAGATPSIAE